MVPPSLVGVGAALLGHDLVEQEQERGGGVDRHRGGDDGLVDAVHQAAHVVERRDGDTGAPDLAEGAGIVRIEAELGGQVEGDAEAGLAAGEQQTVALVALLGGGHAGVLAHGPAAAPVHGRVDAAGVGEDARIGQIPGRLRRAVDRLDGDSRIGFVGRGWRDHGVPTRTSSGAGWSAGEFSSRDDATGGLHGRKGSRKGGGVRRRRAP